MWIIVKNYLPFLGCIISFIICLISMGNKNISNKNFFNKFVLLDVFINAVFFVIIKQTECLEIIYPVLLIDVFLLLIAFIKDIRSKLLSKYKIYSIILHIAVGFLLYVILEILGKIICIVLDILWDIINFFAGNSITENIIFILAIPAVIIFSIIIIIGWGVISEVISIILSPFSSLFDNNNYDSDSEDEYEEDEWIQDQYGEMCKVDHLPTLSGSSYTDSNGKRHDLYGSKESGYWDDEGNQYDPKIMYF